MAVTPYVVGQWVRGRAFYGRQELLAEILAGNRNSVWVLGSRRVGKTSLLKQLELLAPDYGEAGYFPIFWDFQGCEEVVDLHEGFRDALFDVAPALEALGIEFGEVDDEDLFAALNKTRRALRLRGRTLLLLGDEAEQLVAIHEREPRFLPRLRRALQSSESIRTVLASTIRLWKLAGEESSTSPFLHGFTPALPLARMAPSSARALVEQVQLDEGSRPSVTPETVDRILESCQGHPYLLQILSERQHELDDVEAAIEEIASDSMVGFFFASDLSMLLESEREVLRLIERQGVATEAAVERALAFGSTAIRGGLRRLGLLGFVDRSPAGEYSIPNRFFRRWLGEASAAGRESGQAGGEGSGVAAGQSSRRLIGGRYRLLEPLGSGSSGAVYKAEDQMLDTTVAIKLLKQEYSVDDDSVERLRREVVLARDLSHPNVLKLYHLGEDEGRRYLTMQFIDGRTLAEVLADDAPLAVDRALTVAVRLASALAALHRHDVLHRDLKPSNVLLDRAGTPHLTDFGLARLQSGPGVTQQGMFVGTPAYASPEQALGRPLDARSDLYAFGAVLFEMLTGKRPFTAADSKAYLEMHAATPAPSPKRLVPDLPDELCALLLRCLAKSPGERVQTADELEHLLGGLLHGLAARPAV